MFTLLLPLTELRSKLGSLTQLLKQHKTITLTFRGKPVAVVRQYVEEKQHQQQPAWGVLHDSALEPAEYSTVKLPTWLYLQYQQQAGHTGAAVSKLVENALTQQLKPATKKRLSKANSLQSLIDLSDEMYKKNPELYKNIPKDISTNYKQYLYGGKK